jgi:hypothetical protein
LGSGVANDRTAMFTVSLLLYVTRRRVALAEGFSGDVHLARQRLQTSADS